MRVKSSAIKNVSYDETTHTLQITFKGNGRSYQYFDVSKRTFNRMLASESIGGFVNRWITPKYDYMPVE